MVAKCYHIFSSNRQIQSTNHHQGVSAWFYQRQRHALFLLPGKLGKYVIWALTLYVTEHSVCFNNVMC